MRNAESMQTLYPLDRPLSLRGAAEKAGFYRSFPVFSWAWCWRRTLIFWPAGIFFFVVQSNILAEQLGANRPLWRVLIESAWVAGLMVATGPVLAAIVRRLRLPSRRELIAIVLALLIGVAVSYALQIRANRGMEENWPKQFAKAVAANRMTQEAADRQLQFYIRATNSPLSIATQLLIFAGVGGLFAMRAYLDERRLWENELRTREITALRDQRDESDRKLSVLQAQVEPHFLYNTLASIRSLVRSDPGRAEATIDALVDHLRASLPKFRDSHRAPTTLGSQLELCRSYLEVMRVRMGQRLSYSISVPSELTELSFPPLMLVPLVENAIKHGVEPKAGPCAITIDAKALPNQMLEVSVLDTGAGLREGPSDGVGLANIRAQLAARFEGRASIELQSRSAGGVVATIRLPAQQVET
jgi:sensor histidine kinase YesM